MKIPERLRINGIEHQILFRDHLDDGERLLCGRINHLDSTIELWTAASHEMKCVTMLHEALHAMESMAGLELGDDREHVIDIFAHGMYQLLQDNGRRLFDLEGGGADG